METSEILLAVGFALIVTGGVWWWLARKQRAVMLARLAEPLVREEEATPEVARSTGLAPGNAWISYTAAILVGVILHWGVGLNVAFSGALALAGVVITSIVVSNVTQRRAHRYETQLVEAIDLVVAGLHAGAGTLDALDAAAREVRPPLRGHLKNLVGSIRLGEPPKIALEDLARSIPLESYRLFTFTLSVHQETGGSLAPTLATVGRTIRDRVDLKRRVRAETTEAQASVVGILAISYAIALITWRTYPDRVESFLRSELGLPLVSVAVSMQAIGLFWMSQLIKIRH